MKLVLTILTIWMMSAMGFALGLIAMLISPDHVGVVVAALPALLFIPSSIIFALIYRYKK